MHSCAASTFLLAPLGGLYCQPMHGKRSASAIKMTKIAPATAYRARSPAPSLYTSPNPVHEKVRGHNSDVGAKCISARSFLFSLRYATPWADANRGAVKSLEYVVLFMKPAG